MGSKLLRGEIVQKVAEIICDSLKDNGTMPSTNDVQKELIKYIKDKKELNRKIKKNAFSPSEISSLKKDALDKDNDLIDFSLIKLKKTRDDELEEQVKNKFNLDRAIVVTNNHINSMGMSIKDALGLKAAEYFEEVVEDSKRKDKKTKIVLSCGSTIDSMIDNIEKSYNSLLIYSSITLCVNEFEKMSPSQLVHKFAHKFDGVECTTFQLPEIILSIFDNAKNEATESSSARKLLYELLRKSFFNSALEADYFFLGIGGTYQKDDNKPRRSSENAYNVLLKRIGCEEAFFAWCSGEISYWPIIRQEKRDSQHGNSIWLWDYLKDKEDKELSVEEISLKRFFNHVYTVHFEEIRRRKSINPSSRNKVVVVAGGEEKCDAIFSCLSLEHFIDVIITDSNTAKNILSR